MVNIGISCIEQKELVKCFGLNWTKKSLQEKKKKVRPKRKEKGFDSINLQSID